jgi:hypothetical protein
MTAPTYTLTPPTFDRERYLADVGRFADLVVARGHEELGHLVEAYGDFVEATGAEARRSTDEYLVEALALGVLWRARGAQAAHLPPTLATFARDLAARRRAGEPKRRDGSSALLLSIDLPFEPGHPSPSLEELDELLTWLVASGEYDDEARRLEGWERFLRADRLSGEDALEELVRFAWSFEAWAENHLGRYTAGVARFLRDELPRRRWREDTVQCARRPSEYHLSMVGAELLNRAWRRAFLATRRQVVVLPGCLRSRADEACQAERRAHDLRCQGCAVGCPLAAASRTARAAGAEAVGVLHGSDFGAFLRSPALAGGDVGIVGVACAPGLLGAGWRARELGLPAQCVLLDASGCEHWRDRPAPTRLDLGELARILGDEPATRRDPVAAPVPTASCA